MNRKIVTISYEREVGSQTFEYETKRYSYLVANKDLIKTDKLGYSKEFAASFIPNLKQDIFYAGNYLNNSMVGHEVSKAAKCAANYLVLKSEPFFVKGKKFYKNKIVHKGKVITLISVMMLGGWYSNASLDTLITESRSIEIENNIGDNIADITDYDAVRAKAAKKLEKNKIKVAKKVEGRQRKAAIEANMGSAVQVLNRVEGFYCVPYFDYSQLSVGYGSYISQKDAIILWHRMGLSEKEGERLAYKLHGCGFKKVKQLLAHYERVQGSMTRQEAAKLRDAQLAVFRDFVDTRFSFLPNYQRDALSITVYNTGITGFYGGIYYRNGVKHIAPKSGLAEALETRDYWDSLVWNEYVKLKITIKRHYSQGLYNRRKLERARFFSAFSVDHLIAYKEMLKKF